MHAVPSQLTTVPRLQPCTQYPLSSPQYLDSSHACSTHSADHSTWTPAMHAVPTQLTTVPETQAVHAVPTQLTTVPELRPCMQYPLSSPQYLNSCYAWSTHSADHST
uniref:Uncharacterized protein n=1 Tax=Branchiostoma floridae TaxID=7739 RepID=C3YUX2_BRAFL|eukprot:XP_002600011.1 hypothetical protein BRAFLDRAFT_74128 [Branchiostoma floridae]